MDQTDMKGVRLVENFLPSQNSFLRTARVFLFTEMWPKNRRRRCSLTKSPLALHALLLFWDNVLHWKICRSFYALNLFSIFFVCLSKTRVLQFYCENRILLFTITFFLRNSFGIVEIDKCSFVQSGIALVLVSMSWSPLYTIQCYS